MAIFNSYVSSPEGTKTHVKNPAAFHEVGMIREHGEPLAITIDFPQIGMELLHCHNDATGARGKAAAPIGLTVNVFIQFAK